MALGILNRRAGLRAAIKPWLRPGSSAACSRFPEHTQAENRLDRRPLHTQTTVRQEPKPTPFVPDVKTFFSLIGRDLSRHADKVASWEQLFKLTSVEFRKLGIDNARTRRYLFRWLQRFREGSFGVGGDARFVDPEGNVNLRLVEVQVSEEEAQRQAVGAAQGSVNATPHSVMRVLNVPYTGPKAGEAAEPESEETTAEASTEDAEAEAAEEPIDAAQEESSKAEKVHISLPPLTLQALRDAVPIKGVTYSRGRGIRGSNVQLLKHTKGQMAIIKPTPGLWESRRGVKLDGGERRRAEVRFKQRRAQ